MADLDDDAVDDALEALEGGMQSAETYHGHEDVRPTGVAMGRALKEAYHAIVTAHPAYTLKEGGDD